MIRRLFAALAALLLAGAVHAQAAAPRVQFDTTAGRFVVELDPVRAPKTVANFLEYVKSGHYAGTVFHRVIEGFMIQGGGFTAEMVQKPTRAPVPLEAGNGLSNTRGTLAMARTSNPDSATAQFFVNVVNNSRSLDAPNPDGHGYTVFGRVVEGMNVVDRIRAVPTATRNGMGDVPVTPVVITSATLLP